MIETQQIWDQFNKSLRGFIRRRVHDDHVADDLLQDVFVKIHDKLDSLVDSDRLGAWLYRIAHNVIVDHLRRRSTVGLEVDEPQADHQSDQSIENLNNQVGRWLSDLVTQLPPGYREAVILSELEGVPQTEIAKQIGLSVSGSKSRVQRGRRMLKHMLLQCCHFDFDHRGNVIDYHAKTSCDVCSSSEDGTECRPDSQL